MSKPEVLIVSPALAQENNGNWQTAQRWSRLLKDVYSCRIVKQWDPQVGEPAAMLALHAKRSATSIEQWAQLRSSRSLAVVLTGTDLYRDIQSDLQAQRSLGLASNLVVLQELGPLALPPKHRNKARVIFQSTSTRQTLTKTSKHLRVVMVGHLREEKSPQTLMQAALLLKEDNQILIDHIGSPLDPDLAALAMKTSGEAKAYRWLGGLDHEATRRRIQAAHVLVHCSRMEGGAHVLMEAICSGTPVLASRIDGNVGMLGDGYPGYFTWGDAQSLADLLRRCRNDGTYVEALKVHCRKRAHLFEPGRERDALLALVNKLTMHPSA